VLVWKKLAAIGRCTDLAINRCENPDSLFQSVLVEVGFRNLEA